MIDLHNTYSTDTGLTAPQKTTAESVESSKDNFRDALSDATSSDKSKLSSLTPKTSESAASSTSAPDNGYDPFLQAAYSNPFASVSTESTTQTSSVAASTTTSSETATSSLDAQQSFDNAYWASQPTAVQALRNIQDPTERTELATQLANEGYTIDVPIMVWGWDPSTTMAARAAEGYTWVPSALQNSVDVAPGLPTMGTLAAYDPNNPPAGSIAVLTSA